MCYECQRTNNFLLANSDIEEAFIQFLIENDRIDHERDFVHYMSDRCYNNNPLMVEEIDVHVEANS